MEYIIKRTNNDDELMHYGVLGMKWGHIKANPQLSNAKKAYKQVKKEYSKAYNSAYGYSSRHPVGQFVSKKKKAESDKRWADAATAAKKERQASNFSLKRAFPMFILYFILAAIFTTVCVNVGVDSSVFAPLKELSKFLIIMAMVAIGLNSNVIQLIKTGGKPIAVGATCWCGITIVSLVMQHVMHIW